MKVFNINEIRNSLKEVLKNFKKINETLSIKREDLTQEHVDNIIKAYEYLNELLKNEIVLFSKAGFYSLLELNHIILCGSDPEKRAEYHRHIMETRDKFNAKMPEILTWYEKAKKTLNPYELATGFYWRQLSQPQVFIEGNHRTGNILINYILLGLNKPPFIINTENAWDYFEHSGKIKFSSKEKLVHNLFNLPKYGKDFEKVLREESSDKYTKG